VLLACAIVVAGAELIEACAEDRTESTSPGIGDASATTFSDAVAPPRTVVSDAGGGVSDDDAGAVVVKNEESVCASRAES
jgi:hypothetical protein